MRENATDPYRTDRHTHPSVKRRFGSAKKIGYQKYFIRETLQEVRVRGREVRLTYKPPMGELLLPKETLEGRGSLHCINWWRRGESKLGFKLLILFITVLIEKTVAPKLVP